MFGTLDMHTHTHTHTHIHMYICEALSTCRLLVYGGNSDGKIHTYKFTYIYIYIYIYIHVYTYACVYAYIHTYRATCWDVGHTFRMTCIIERERCFAQCIFANKLDLNCTHRAFFGMYVRNML